MHNDNGHADGVVTYSARLRRHSRVAVHQLQHERPAVAQHADVGVLATSGVEHRLAALQHHEAHAHTRHTRDDRASMVRKHEVNHALLPTFPFLPKSLAKRATHRA
jgi:hypothetical protein